MNQTSYAPVHLSPYRAGVCWYGVRAKEANGPQRYCGAGAGKYRVTKRCSTVTGDGVPLLGVLTDSVDIREVWLCYKHVTAMEERGYCCHMIEE